jgi:hypothetical protein
MCGPEKPCDSNGVQRLWLNPDRFRHKNKIDMESRYPEQGGRGARFNCVLCESPLTESTRPEHILLKALGGRKTSTIVLCSYCNNMMGGGPDNELAESVRVIRNICDFKDGEGRPAPAIASLEAGVHKFDLLPGGNIKPVIKQQVQVSRFDDGTPATLAVRASTHDFGRRVEDALVGLGFDGSQIDDFKRAFVENAELVSVPVPSTVFNLSFGTIGALRSIAKSCLTLWSLAAGNAEMLRPAYSELKHFILTGEIDGSGSSVIDLRTDPLPEQARRFSTIPHFIWVGSDSKGQVRGYFHLYGLVGWSVLLCNSGAPPNLRYALFSDPEDPRRWEDGPSTGTWLNFEWVSTPPQRFDSNLIKENLARLHVIAQEKSKQILFDRSFEIALQELNLTADQELSADQVKRFSEHLLHHLVYGLFKVSYVRKGECFRIL